MSRQPLSILLVEGADADAALIDAMLAGPGRLTVTLHRARSLDEALAQLDVLLFDAVLLDPSLPDTRGLDAVQRLVRHRLPVVVLTGHDDESVGFAAIDAGAADCLTKDQLTRARLTRTLYNAVQAARIARDLETQRNLLESVLESLPDAVIVVDRGGRLHPQNRAAARLLSAAPSASGHHPLARETAPWSRVRAGETVDGAELSLPGADGTDRWLSANIRPFAVDGRPQGGVAVLRDITERRAREAQVSALNDELRRQIEERSRAVVGLEAANRLKAQFLDIVSHELRTPLTPIVGYARLLLRKRADLDLGQREAVQQIAACGQQLQDIVEQIFEFQTLRSEPVTVRPGPFDPRALLEGLLERARGQIGDAPVELTLVVETLPDTLVADAEQIGGIVRRLLDNAVTFTPHGRVELHTRFADGRWAIEVRDSGVGIDAEHLEFIFGEFYQVEPSAVRSHGGLGLGLAYARFLAEALGGELGVRSTPGQGSAFRVRVPALAPSFPADAPLTD